MEECQRNEVFAVAVSTIDQVVDNNLQLEARDYFVDIDHPVAGKFRYPGAPIFNNNGWWSIRMPAPLLGQHNEEILSELGYADESISKLRQKGVIGGNYSSGSPD